MSSTINVKTLRHEMGRIIERVKRGEQFTVLYRSRPAFRIVPLQSGFAVGLAEDDSLFGAAAVGASSDCGTAADHDRVLYGRSGE